MLYRSIKEGRRILRDYVAGTMHNASHWYQLPTTATRILKARLRFGLGPRHYSLFGLNRVSASMWSDYLTDVPSFKQYLRDQSPSAMHRFTNDKAVFHAHCQAFGLSSAPIVCIVGSEANAYTDVPVATGVEELAALLEDAPSALFAKQMDGTFGIGAFPLDKHGQGLAFNGRSGSVQDLFDHLRAGSNADVQWLIQPRLRNHEGLSGLMSPHALGTIRVVTCMTDNRAVILFALLKLTVGKNSVDNFHGGLTGNLVASIDIASGTLAAARGSRSSDWPIIQTVERHPDSGLAIAGFKLPQWSEVSALVIRAQQSVPDLRSAGWDVAVTPDGPVLLEANLTYSTDILQVAYGRGLKTELFSALKK